MRRAWLSLTLALAAGALGSPARAETPEEIFLRGSAAYERGDYAQAAEAYRTVAQYGVRDPRLEYNLGNAAFKLGRLGEAMLHYQRAARMAPTDPDIAANLALARSRCVDDVRPPEVAAPVRILRGIQDRIGPDRQVLLAVALVWAAAGVIAWRSSKPGGWSPAWGWTLAALVLAASIAGLSWSTTLHRLEGAPLAVVLDPAVDVLAGPGENNAALFTVHEGLTVEVRSEREDWVQVSLPNGLNGWVPRKALGVV
jgi:tetratricopeptide (TPR) repeat protein